jgi:hypothetical protein
MKNKIIKSLLIAIIIMLSSFSIISNASIIDQLNKQDITFKNTNQQIYLGYVIINGNGSNSNLQAVAENNLLVGINDKTSFVDFYINYTINCSGETDNGQVWLTVAINGQNITPVFFTSFNESDGVLKISNIEVNRQDGFQFIIEVIYASVTPLYTNHTQAIGGGIINKSTNYKIDYKNQFYQILEKLNYRFPFFERILNHII